MSWGSPAARAQVLPAWPWSGMQRGEPGAHCLHFGQLHKRLFSTAFQSADFCWQGVRYWLLTHVMLDGPGRPRRCRPPDSERHDALRAGAQHKLNIWQLSETLDISPYCKWLTLGGIMCCRLLRVMPGGPAAPAQVLPSWPWSGMPCGALGGARGSAFPGAPACGGGGDGAPGDQAPPPPPPLLFTGAEARAAVGRVAPGTAVPKSATSVQVLKLVLAKPAQQHCIQQCTSFALHNRPRPVQHSTTNGAC